jgi:GTPase SAR1 family protein
MLVFFIHGVATKDAGYSRQLEALIKEEFIKRNQPLPHFYASFWGNILKQTGQIWNWVHQDLQDFKRNYPKVDAQDIFRYQEFRQDFISEFFGDILTYCNTERGRKIRELIAQGLRDLAKAFSSDNELHIVTHSLGSVVLWDVLFSDKYDLDDPAYEIRSIIKSLSHPNNQGETYLKSITTMGSPVLFFNMMLNISPETIRGFADKYGTEPLRWINILHASDIIAYPLRASLNANSISSLFFRDKYIWADANVAEKGARIFGQAHAAMALGVADAHSYYWRSRGAARLIAANILGDYTVIDSATIDTE